MAIVVIAIPIFFTISSIDKVYSQEPYGSITGIVIDKVGSGVPAMVELYQNGQMYLMPENPQITYKEPLTGQIGRYVFYNLPYGQYTVTATYSDAAGNKYPSSVNVSLNDGTVSRDIVILVYPRGLHFPLVTPTPTLSPPPSLSPSPAGYEWLMLCGVAIGIAVVSLRKRMD
jgi:hypothetical protein